MRFSRDNFGENAEKIGLSAGLIGVCLGSETELWNIISIQIKEAGTFWGREFGKLRILNSRHLENHISEVGHREIMNSRNMLNMFPR